MAEHMQRIENAQPKADWTPPQVERFGSFAEATKKVNGGSDTTHEQQSQTGSI